MLINDVNSSVRDSRLDSSVEIADCNRRMEGLKPSWTYQWDRWGGCLPPCCCPALPPSNVISVNAKNIAGDGVSWLIEYFKKQIA